MWVYQLSSSVSCIYLETMIRIHLQQKPGGHRAILGPHTDAISATGKTGSGMRAPEQLLLLPLDPHWHMTPQLSLSVAHMPYWLQHSKCTINVNSSGILLPWLYSTRQSKQQRIKKLCGYIIIVIIIIIIIIIIIVIVIVCECVHYSCINTLLACGFALTQSSSTKSTSLLVCRTSDESSRLVNTCLFDFLSSQTSWVEDEHACCCKLDTAWIWYKYVLLYYVDEL